MDNKEQKIVIYESPDREIKLKVNLQNESVWLTQEQIALLFGVNRPAVTKHIRNIFNDKELIKDSVCSKMEHTTVDGKKYKTQFYNMDAIISVGYRINSVLDTQFRIWATSVLKNFIINGYALNKERLFQKGLEELNQAVKLISNTVKSKQLSLDESMGLVEVISGYASSWLLLQKYDENSLKKPKAKKAKFKLGHDFCVDAINRLKQELVKKKEAPGLFGLQRNKQLEGIVNSIYQTFDGKDLYDGIAEKSANLFYLIIKDHPFTDGNKRIASFLFILFLAKNDYLYNKKGDKKINNNERLHQSLGYKTSYEVHFGWFNKQNKYIIS